MVRIVLAMLVATLGWAFVGCSVEPVPIEKPPAPGEDPARAFPQFNLAYRGTGAMPSEESPYRGRLSVRYFRFFENGVVRNIDASTDRTCEVTTRVSAGAFADLASAEPIGVLSGRYEVKGDQITIRLGRDNVTNGRAWRSESLYRGTITGDQIRLTRYDPKTEKRMSPEWVYWPASM